MTAPASIRARARQGLVDPADVKRLAVARRAVNQLANVARVAELAERERPACGATCRDGHACRAKPYVWPDGHTNGRCRNHGGMNPRRKAGG